MKRKNLITIVVLISLFFIALIAQANFNPKSIERNAITFDSKNRTYHPNSSIPFLSQPIEQKYLTIRSINAIESRLEKN